MKIRKSDKLFSLYVRQRDKWTCQNHSKVYDLANKGIYNRNFDNWEWLCRKCHMLSDGRLENLINANKNKVVR